ncbi:MAG: L,D-transpeptidase family protein [Lachnospiraceae bacterium]|nr:L,D-transpeptidase family protein [Lachnospiraceae bacterium]
MNEKKKIIQKEETDITAKENSTVTDFEDLYEKVPSSELKKDEGESSTGKMPKEEISDKKEEKKEVTESGKETVAEKNKDISKKEGSSKEEKKDLSEKEEAIEDKNNESKEESVRDEKKDADKKIETDKDEKKDFGKTEESAKNDKKDSARMEESAKDDKKDSVKTKESAKDDKRDLTEKKESGEDKKNQSHNKDIKGNEKKVISEEEKKPAVSGNAITQSKRIEEAKKAAEQNAVDNTKPKSKKTMWIVLGLAASLLIIAYFTGYIYFSGHFYQDVAINGVNVSGMNKELAKQTLDNFYKDYVLTIETIDGNQITIDGKDISMQISLRDEFNVCLKKQQAYLWFVNMFSPHEFEIGADAKWEDSALSDIFNEMKMLDKKVMVAPKDAFVGVEDGKFTIVKEVLGSTIDRDKFEAAVRDSLSSVMASLVMMEAGCYDLPDIYDTDEELKEELELKNEYAQSEVKLQLDDITLEPGMELYDEVLEKKNDSYEVSQKLVRKYVQSLAKEYNTLDSDRTFTTSFNDKTVKVYGSAFGYELNEEETEKVLYKALTSGKPSTVDVVFDSKGYTLDGENDIGDTYIEVNLSEQKVIAYKNGKKLAEGDCVSGKEAAGHGTCIGLYAIQDKLSPTVLRGEKKPVTKTVTKKKGKKKVKVQETTYEYEYESPVTFWMQFNGGIGLHDAAGWRSTYGGSIYYYSGSHGCVNLPYSLAETLYKNYDIGDPVVVYFWDNENRR